MQASQLYLAYIAIVLGTCVSSLASEVSSASADSSGSRDRVVASRELASWIDDRVAGHLAQQNAAPPSLVDDATFLRRAYVDLHGTIPKVAQVRDFLNDSSSEKRAALIDRLLADDRANAQLARSWRRLLMPGAPQTTESGAAFEAWLLGEFAGNKPIDAVTRAIVTAGGAEPSSQEDAGGAYELDGDEPEVSGAVAYLQAAGADPPSVAGAISRDFLGVRIECAQCHDHPFADWKQDQFWGMAAFFAGAPLNRPRASPPGEQLPRDRPVVTISPPELGKTFAAEFLWSSAPIVSGGEQLPRQLFAEWLTSPENPHFAATVTNRVWRQLCGRGLTQSVEDLDAATPEERAAVLDDLAERFANDGFDLKTLIGGICKSRPYQYEVDENVSTATLVGVRPLKALSPEQVFDALETAVGLPISRMDAGPRFNGERERMVARLSEAASKDPEEFRGGVPQMLMLMNGTTTADAVDLETSGMLRAVVEASFLDDAEKLDVLFLATLTRHPTASEQKRLQDHIASTNAGGRKADAYAEILWALVNGPEFVLLR